MWETVMPEVVAIAKGFWIWRAPIVAPVPESVKSTAVGVEVAAEATPAAPFVEYSTPDAVSAVVVERP